MNPITLEEITEKFSEILFLCKPSQAYEFDYKNDLDYIPSEIIVVRSRNAYNGIIVYCNYNNKDDWSINDPNGFRYLIRELLSGNTKFEPLNSLLPPIKKGDQI